MKRALLILMFLTLCALPIGCVDENKLDSANSGSYKLQWFRDWLIDSRTQEHSNGEREDGYWWEKMPDEAFKVVYIRGWSDGVSRVLNDLFYFNMPDSEYAKYQKSKEPPSHITNTAYKILFEMDGIYELTYGQLLDGLNEFYKDYRNKKILFVYAMQIVKLELSGEKKEIIEEWKRWFRVDKNTMSNEEYRKKLAEHMVILDGLENR